MPGGVGVDPERLLGIFGAVLEQAGAESKDSLVLSVQVSSRRNRQIQVQHLWAGTVGPRGARQLHHLLESEAGNPLCVLQHQPVLSVWVLLTSGRRFVSWAVPQPQQPSVELR